MDVELSAEGPSELRDSKQPLVEIDDEGLCMSGKVAERWKLHVMDEGYGAVVHNEVLLEIVDLRDDSHIDNCGLGACCVGLEERIEADPAFPGPIITG